MSIFTYKQATESGVKVDYEPLTEGEAETFLYERTIDIEEGKFNESYKVRLDMKIVNPEEVACIVASVYAKGMTEDFSNDELNHEEMKKFIEAYDFYLEYLLKN